MWPVNANKVGLTTTRQTYIHMKTHDRQVINVKTTHTEAKINQQCSPPISQHTQKQHADTHEKRIPR